MFYVFLCFFFMFYVIRRLHVQKTFIHIQSVKGLILVKRIFFNDFVSNLTLHMLVKMGLPYNGKAQQFSKRYTLTSKIQQPSPKFIRIIVTKCTLSTILSEVYIFRWRLTVSIRTASFEQKFHSIFSEVFSSFCERLRKR